MSNARLVRAAVTLVAVALLAPRAGLAVTLQDNPATGRASSIEFLAGRVDLDGNPTTKNPSGFHDLRDTEVVNGASLELSTLFELQVWIRTGDIGPETALANLNLVGGPTTSDLDGDPGDEFVEVMYSMPGVYDVTLTGELISPPDGTPAGLFSQMIVTNTSGGTLDFHFFTYWDIDIADLGSGLNEEIEFLAPTAFIQDETFAPPIEFEPPGSGLFLIGASTLVQTLGGVGVELLGHEASAFPSLFNSLEDGSPTTLSGADTVPNALNEDLVAAFHHRVAAVGDGGQITFTLSPFSVEMPEPALLMLLGFGLAGLAFVGRPRRD